jgi:hypothetical protein
MVVVVAVMSASVLVFKEKKLNEKKSKKTKCEVEGGREDEILNLGGNECKVTIIYLLLSMRHT